MTDARLRELERRWRETGSVDDEAVFLQERVRAGALAPQALALAAGCGHRAAAIALGRKPVPDEALARFGELIAVAGTPGLIAVLVAVVESILARVDDRSIAPGARGIPWSRGTVDWLLDRAREWLRCPCEEHGFRMPTHFWLSEHEHAVTLAGILHYGACGKPTTEDPDDLAGRAGWFVRELAALEKADGDAVLIATTLEVAKRALG